jgi:hypothetical protein
MANAAAAKLGGNQRRKKPVLFQNVVMFGNEYVAGIAFGGILGKAWPDGL